MRVPLKSMFEASAQKESNFLLFKRKMNTWKKQGVAFFVDDLAGLDERGIIEIYFHKVPSKKSEPKAFPIPSAEYIRHVDVQTRYNYVKDYYTAYYTNHEFSISEFLTYESVPFVGEHFVWFYKK